jgi:hypothetical protein
MPWPKRWKKNSQSFRKFRCGPINDLHQARFSTLLRFSNRYNDEFFFHPYPFQVDRPALLNIFS